jgi:hypothetical protein
MNFGMLTSFIAKIAATYNDTSAYGDNYGDSVVVGYSASIQIHFLKILLSTNISHKFHDDFLYENDYLFIGNYF